MPAYPDVANPDLLHRIPLTARLVLDVGCGGGALGAAYRLRNPNARILGIETDADSARRAATRLDAVANVDVEHDPRPFPATPEFQPVDCIVYGDLLEHLRDPWRLLREQLPLLAPDGVVLICMPNAEHWSFADQLLRGGWAYQDQGLFDRSHLRWFTPATTQAALHDAGLQPIDVAPRIFDLPRARAFAADMAPALRLDPETCLRRCAPLQHVWRAVRQSAPRLHLAATMLAPIGGVSDIRVVEPMAALASAPSLRTELVTVDDLPDLGPDDSGICILHRPLLTGEDGLAILRRLTARGYLTVCEFDDHPDYIPVLQRPDVQNFRAVHAIQTTTPTLAAHFRTINPHVAVFPNAIARLPVVCNHADPARQTLFFGGLNRDADWPELLPALNAVAASAGPRLQFRIVADRALFDALDTPHKAFTPLCDYATYRTLLQRCEISFMPLRNTVFNRCKSDLKFLEAASFGVTALASETVYAGSIEDGRTGVLFADADSLRQRLTQLVDDPATGRAIGEAAREHVARHRMLAYQIGRRAAWYHDLWQRRAELRADLAARVPELADPQPAQAAPPASASLLQCAS